MTTRRALPNRRRTETHSFHHAGVLYVATVGVFHGGGLAEIFLRGGKTGSHVEAFAHDAAVTVSLALQFGVPLAALRNAVMRLDDGSAAGPLGKALDLIDARGHAHE